MTTAILTIIGSILGIVAGYFLNGLIKKWLQKGQDSFNKEEVAEERKRDQALADKLNSDLGAK